MFTVVRMGCACRHDRNFMLDVPGGFEGYLMLYVYTRAVFRINGTDTVTEPGTFIIFPPHVPVHYSAADGEYINDWMHFTCSEGISSAVVTGIPVFIDGRVDVPQYYKLIADCFYRSGNKQTVGLLIRALLSEVFLEEDDGHMPHYRELLDLRRMIYASPAEDWTIERMAKSAGMSEPYLYKLYKRAFGITCNADVIKSRIELAEHYLASTDHNIEEIAYLCGYKSAVHFSRQFKQIRGTSPTEWRKEI